jgi:hypothetical protein
LWVKVGRVTACIVVFVLSWIISTRLLGRLEAPAPGATKPIASLPAEPPPPPPPPAPAPVTAAPAPPPTTPAPEASAPAASASAAAARPKPVPGRGVTPAPAPAAKPGKTPLPAIEHCYETVGMTRREVPCR